MTKRSIALATALILLMLATLAGLPWMTRCIESRRVDKPIYVTPTPMPIDDSEN